MADLLLERTPWGFQPADEEARVKAGAWSVGEIARAKISKPRNGNNHRRFRKLLEETCKHLPEGRELTPDALLLELKLRTGYVDVKISPVPTRLATELKRGVRRLRKTYQKLAAKGVPAPALESLKNLGVWLTELAESDDVNTVIIPRSTSFADLDEAEFRVHYDEWAKIISRDYLNCTEEQFNDLVGLL